MKRFESTDRDPIRKEIFSKLAFAADNDLWCVITLQLDVFDLKTITMSCSYFEARIDAEKFLSTKENILKDLAIKFFIYSNLGFVRKTEFIDGGLFEG